MTLRVVQWTTGSVGKQSVTAIAAHPEMELVGCYAWSGDKLGRDAGELCGLDPLGIAPTNDVDALLALKPDCVVYNPVWPSTDEPVRILESGANVIPVVVAAPPRIVSYPDVTLPLPRGLVSP